MKNIFFQKKKRKGLLSLRIILPIILLANCLSYFQNKNHEKWVNSEERIFVRELESIEIESVDFKGKPKPPIKVKPISENWVYLNREEKILKNKQLEKTEQPVKHR